MAQLLEVLLSITGTSGTRWGARLLQPRSQEPPRASKALRGLFRLSPAGSVPGGDGCRAGMRPGWQRQASNRAGKSRSVVKIPEPAGICFSSRHRLGVLLDSTLPTIKKQFSLLWPKQRVTVINLSWKCTRSCSLVPIQVLIWVRGS